MTLSDRFIIALCTNPPIPFVGDAGREPGLSKRSGEMRPCDGDIAKPRDSSMSLFGGSNLCALVKGTGEPMTEPLEPFPSPKVPLEGDEIRSMGSSDPCCVGLVVSRDIPGICTRAELNP